MLPSKILHLINKQNEMKNKLIGFFAIAFLIVLSACSGPDSDPKQAAKAFYEAIGKKDFEKAAQYATKDSKTMLDLIKSMSEMGNQMKIETTPEEEASMKNAIYSDAEINGDNAVVTVSVDGKENKIKLKKEEGAWKVAMDKDTIKETAAEKSGESVEDLNAKMDETMQKMNEIPMDSLKKIMDKAGDILKNDTLKQAMEKAGEMMKKAGEAMQEAGKEMKNQ
jgi:hypothetical protein